MKLKRDRMVIGVVVVLFACVSYLSFTSIQQMQGNARVINYVGIVRGATQKLVKKELMGYPDEELLLRLDSIVEELITGEGENGLIVLADSEYLANMREVRAHWSEIKALILEVREGTSNEALFASSEQYFDLVDRTVSSAEAFSESQVSRSRNMLLGVNGVFVLILIVGIGYYIRTAALSKRAEILGKMAYTDPLTQMPNRASCQREFDRHTNEPPEENLAVLMFDMNNLKRVNDELGHQSGDRIIADFARIIKTEAANYGFVGRYGGDEFIGVFVEADEEKMERYLTGVDEKIIAYNLLRPREIERLSYAVGYVIQNLKDGSIEEMINEADRRMYVRKRQMKAVRDEL